MLKTNESRAIKTAVIDIRDLLSPLSARGVEKQLATVRYDETLTGLDAIQAKVRECGHHCSGELVSRHLCEQAHEERSMHGGVPRGKMHHLVISVFDSKTRARITDATLTGSVTEPGMAIQRKPLESMSFGGAVSYGNYFAMPNQGPYEILVTVQRPGNSKTATTRFKYWHPR